MRPQLNPQLEWEDERSVKQSGPAVFSITSASQQHHAHKINFLLCPAAQRKDHAPRRSKAEGPASLFVLIRYKKRHLFSPIPMILQPQFEDFFFIAGTMLYLRVHDMPGLLEDRMNLLFILSTELT